MANSASLLLPGSNLTNLIVLAHEHVPGHLFAARMLPAWIAAVTATIALLLIVYRHRLARAVGPGSEAIPFRLGYGTMAVAVAAVLVLALQRPAIPVFAAAIALALLARLRPRTAFTALNPLLLVGLFAAAVALGTVARGVESLDDLTRTLGRWPTAGVGAGASVLINNLPAAVVLSRPCARTSARALARPRPGAEPRGHRLTLGGPLVASGPPPRRAALGAALLGARSRPRPRHARTSAARSTDLRSAAVLA
jgi:arsenical pump membrane protein